MVYVPWEDQFILATKSLADASLKAGVRENIEVGIYLDLERIKRAIEQRGDCLVFDGSGHSPLQHGDSIRMGKTLGSCVRWSKPVSGAIKV